MLFSGSKPFMSQLKTYEAPYAFPNLVCTLSFTLHFFCRLKWSGQCWAIFARSKCQSVVEHIIFHIVMNCYIICTGKIHTLSFNRSGSFAKQINRAVPDFFARNISDIPKSFYHAFCGITSCFYFN